MIREVFGTSAAAVAPNPVNGVALAVLIAVILGGWGLLFDSAQGKVSATNPTTGELFGSIIPGATSFNTHWTFALGSALALSMYPHSITGVLATKSCNTIRRNAVVLALHTIMLGLLARLGYVAIKAGTIPVGLVGTIDPQLVMPQLFPDNFPRWFAGIAQTAIGAGSIMPAAITAHHDRRHLAMAQEKNPSNRLTNLTSSGFRRPSGGSRLDEGNPRQRDA